MDKKRDDFDNRKERLFNFKRKNNLETYDLPTKLGAPQKKVKFSEEVEGNKEKEKGTVLKNSQQKEEAQKLYSQYGKGFTMLAHLGFEIGKGLGKEKQGRINPLEAVKKTSYNSSFENRLESKLKKNRKEEEDEEQDEKGWGNERKAGKEKDDDDQKERQRQISHIKNWKKQWGKKEKVSRENEGEEEGGSEEEEDEENEEGRGRKMEEGNIKKEEGGIKREEGGGMKIIDMRGSAPSYLKDFSSVKPLSQVMKEEEGREERNYLSEFLFDLRRNYDFQKNELHGLERKKQYENDKLIMVQFEFEEVQKSSSSNNSLLLEFKQISSIIQKMTQEQDIQTLMQDFEHLIEINKDKVFEFSLHLIFIKTLIQKLTLQKDIELANLLTNLDSLFPLLKQASELLIFLFQPQFTKETYPTSDDLKEQILQKNLDISLKMLFEAVFIRPLRTYIVNRLGPEHNCDAFIDLMDKFRSIMPKKVFKTVVKNHVVPVLAKFAGAPLGLGMPPHLFLFPFFKLVSPEALPLNLLGSAFLVHLQKWQPNGENSNNTM